MGSPPPAPGTRSRRRQGQALVDRALANEYNAAQDTSHPMRYELLKTSPRLSYDQEDLRNQRRRRGAADRS